MCICLAPCNQVIGKSLGRRDQCIAPKWYTENTLSQLKRAIFIQRAKEAITNSQTTEVVSDEQFNLKHGGMARRAARNESRYGSTKPNGKEGSE